MDYTQLINPWFPQAMIPSLGLLATVAAVLFALSMTFSTGVKGALDYGVYTAAAAAFALGSMKEKYLELDLLYSGKGVKGRPRG